MLAITLVYKPAHYYVWKICKQFVAVERGMAHVSQRASRDAVSRAPRKARHWGKKHAKDYPEVICQHMFWNWRENCRGVQCCALHLRKTSWTLLKWSSRTDEICIIFHLTSSVILFYPADLLNLWQFSSDNISYASSRNGDVIHAHVFVSLANRRNRIALNAI